MATSAALRLVPSSEPPSVNDRVLDQTIHHAVDLERYSNQVVAKLIALLNCSDDDLLAKLDVQMAKMGRSRSIVRLDELLTAVREVNVAAYRRLARELTTELKEFTEVELDWQARLLEKEVPLEVLRTVAIATVAPETVAAAALARPFQGVLLKEALSELSEDRARLVRDAVRLGFVESETIDQIVRRLRGTKAQGYADGLLERPRHHLESLVRTAINHTASYARDQFFQANTDLVAGWVFTATLDSRTSLTCASLHGRRFDVGSGPKPPRHWNCLPGDTVVSSSSRITGASKRWFDGEVVVIKTASGRTLTSTPNHPILTSGGWIGSGSLNVGGDVVCDLSGEWGGISNGNHENMPARIENVVSAFFASSKVRPAPVPLTTQDFHGDGEGSKIAIVATERLLRHGLNTALQQHGRELCFINRDFAGSRLFISDRHFDNRFLTNRAPATLSIRSLSQLLALLEAGIFHTSKLLFGPIAWLSPVFQQDAVNWGRIGTTKEFRDARRSNTGIKQFQDSLCREVDSSGSKRLSGFFERSDDSVLTDSELATNLSSGLAGSVFVDQIVSIEKRDFRGHVFNLETELGAYTAGGIITHNCRSTMVPVTKSWRNLGINLDELEPGTRASMDGQVPADLTFTQWLRRQGSERQDEVLGATRGKLFRTGKLEVPSFTNQKGVVYTLDQLRQRHAALFDEVAV